MAEDVKKKSARRKNDAQPTGAESSDGGKETSELTETRSAVDAFLADRSQETYDRVLQTFVVEAMTTERSAAFPTSTDIVTKFFANEGPFSSAIVRDGNGQPYLAFLTGHDRENNGAEAVVAMRASEMLTNALNDAVLAGVAIDPWNDGGVALPKSIILQKILEIHNQTSTGKDNMTINIGYFEQQRQAILSADQERLATIKKEIAERIAACNYVATNGEDPTGGWYLYLDALCDLRLGAGGWDGARIISVGAGELDFLADWYESLSEVARSVNRRQKDGRGGCNERKLQALSELMASHRCDIEQLIAHGSEYGKHLLERTEQISRMQTTGNWSTIAKIEVFRGQ